VVSKPLCSTDLRHAGGVFIKRVDYIVIPEKAGVVQKKQAPLKNEKTTFINKAVGLTTLTYALCLQNL